MYEEERVIVNKVFDTDNIEQSAHTVDDIVNVTYSSSSATEIVRTRKRRYKWCMKIVQKLTICFFVLFIAYFAWTISVKVNGDRWGINMVRWNLTNPQNLSVEANNKNISGSKHIPFNSKADGKHTDLLNHTNITLFSNKNETIKRKKKIQNKHQNGNDIYNDLADYLKITVENHKRDKYKLPCSNCKIRKMKGRNRNSLDRISPLVLQKMLEKVADDSLSGARSGQGTITSLFDSDSMSKEEKNLTEISDWRFDQHWVNIAAGGASGGDDNSIYRTDSSPRNTFTPWTTWSSCTTSCGVGQQERLRKCGMACTEVESMVCVNPKCQGVSLNESSSTISEFYKWEHEGFVPPMALPEQEYLNPTIDACENWVKCYKRFAQDFIKNASLPGCPCIYPLIRVKSMEVFDVHLDAYIRWIDSSSQAEMVYKPGAFACMRSAVLPEVGTLSVQQCCYDESYSLFTRGKSAGTPTLISQDISKELHFKVDLLPWVICKGDWTRYNDVLLPNNQYNCPQNPDDETILKQSNQVHNY